MSHVDEGLLHAYIDGAFAPESEQGREIEAHLEVCVDCAVRLEKARELKERAQIVMRRLAPPVIRKPPFEEILARRERADAAPSPVPAAAQEADSTRRRSRFPPLPLAWAASLVLALGAGWMARAYLWQDRVAPVDSFATEAVADDASPGTREAPAGESAAQATAPAPERRESAGDAAAADATPATGAPPPAVAADRTMAARREQVEKVAAASPRAALARAAAPPAADSAVRAADADRRAFAAAAFVDTGGFRTAAAAAADMSNMTVSLTEQTSVATMLRDYAAAAEANDWRPVPDYERTGRLGYEPVAVIDGMEAIRIEETGPEDSPLRRSVYRLEAGATVELLQRLRPSVVALNEVVVAGAPPAAGDSTVAPDTTVTEAGNQLAAEARLARLEVVGDVPLPLRGASLLLVPHPSGPLVLKASQPADALRAMSAGIR